MLKEHVCPWWLSYAFDHRLRRLLHNPEHIVGPYVRRGMTALDLGCGMGYFSIPMARMVGESGRVLAVDIQQKGLDVLMRRARKAGVGSIITPYLCAPNNLCIDDPGDFALAFFMVHETPDPARFLAQLRGCLKSGAACMFAEPKLHVPQSRFEQMLDDARNAGFSVVERPRIAISHAALLVADS